jgi:hypothetical protein
MAEGNTGGAGAGIGTAIGAGDDVDIATGIGCGDPHATSNMQSKGITRCFIVVFMDK